MDNKQSKIGEINTDKTAINKSKSPEDTSANKFSMTSSQQTGDTVYLTATSVENDKIKRDIKRLKKKASLPFFIGISIFVTSIIILLVINLLPNSHACASSTDCGNMYLWFATTIIDTPIIAYGASLSITGLCHLIINRRNDSYKNTHPFLWSFPVFAAIGFLIYQCMVIIHR